eukprot:CAMPEP_0184715504 /NCGR_PEP_ID=MMETSP0314-20130426/5424_1 /TAXON_ID=38298 /ORGANISM="Rhodella maculata, Strain CCMP 736" /LENGTH=50 /DNA_ID=CAMNT_0027178673 /DNA_START=141 /DNA_END=290 /DNA_ORIENTATION=+
MLQRHRDFPRARPDGSTLTPPRALSALPSPPKTSRRSPSRPRPRPPPAPS